MHIYAYLTGDVVRGTTENPTDPDEMGYVDETFSMRVLFPNRNDVRPLSTYSLPTFGSNLEPTPPAEWALDVVERTLGAFENAGDWVDGADSDTDISTGDVWRYAIHFEVKAHVSERIPADLLGDLPYNVVRY